MKAAPFRTMIAVCAGVLLAAFAPPSDAQQVTDTIAPEIASGSTAKPVVHARRHMVVAANPLAAQAGLDILRAGGSAADALIAVQTVLGLVEPQSSGIGGGAFLVWHDGKTGELTTIDGRETAPAAATPQLFLDEDGKPLKFFEAVVGGRSVGTPGVVALMEKLHRRYGRLPWQDDFQPAIELAQKGFEISPRLNAMLAGDRERLGGQKAARAYFYDAVGAPWPIGHLLKNPDYAETLTAVAQGGAGAFYEGRIARDIVAAVQSADNPGLLNLDDLADYEAVERPAICAPYRGFDVCGMGPPSSGALTIGQVLGMVSHFDLAGLGPDDPESWRIIGDATRLAFADRERYMADSDFVALPEGLLDQAYLAERARLISRPTALPETAVIPGEPPWKKAELRLDGQTLSQPSTSHFVIVDDEGNIASMTSSVENAFGSRQMVDGFLLNNQLTDFSFLPAQSGHNVANRVEPRKRPRSSMSPTIVLRDGRPAFALGSPGGSNIIPYVANTLIALIDWKMDIGHAMALPHLTNRFGTYQIEAGTAAQAMADDLKALGYSVGIGELNSGLHGVAFTANGMEGGADPRREGVAVGD